MLINLSESREYGLLYLRDVFVYVSQLTLSALLLLEADRLARHLAPPARLWASQVMILYFIEFEIVATLVASNVHHLL